MEGEIAGKREGRKEGRKKEGKTEEGQKEGSFLLVNKRNKLNTAQSIKIPSHYPVDLVSPAGINYPSHQGYSMSESSGIKCVDL